MMRACPTSYIYALGHICINYIHIAATKESPLCRQFWSNEAKSRPIDRQHRHYQRKDEEFGPRRCNHFWRANIDLPAVSRIQQNRRVLYRPCMITLREPTTTFDAAASGDARHDLSLREKSIKGRKI
jgi:hypothetical protein